MLEDKRIFIAGGAGSIGSELVRQLTDKNEIYILDFNETGLFDLVEELKLEGKIIDGRVGDIRNYETVREAIFEARPDIIFHAAAYKHVTPMELCPKEAIDVNLIGTHNLLRATKEYGLFNKFVFISSDKAVQATSVMGATKRLGELMVRNCGRGFIVVRFANVLGSRGSVIPIWQKQINENKPLTVTDERMVRYFMSIEEAVESVIQATLIGDGGEIFVLDMADKKVNVLELAKTIIKDSDKGIPIKIIGRRPGEMFEEKLMTEDEAKVAVKQDKFWVIRS